jgi:hypothetical protein
MPRVFHRILSFEIGGEIYDQTTKPEDIIKNYEWRFKGFNDAHGDDKCFLEASHRDHRGRIISFNNRPRISKAKKPDTEFFII